jgi:hypothetical protein
VKTCRQPISRFVRAIELQELEFIAQETLELGITELRSELFAIREEEKKEIVTRE